MLNAELNVILIVPKGGIILYRNLQQIWWIPISLSRRYIDSLLVSNIVRCSAICLCGSKFLTRLDGSRIMGNTGINWGIGYCENTFPSFSKWFTYNFSRVLIQWHISSPFIVQLMWVRISYFFVLNYRGESFSYFWGKFPPVTINI